jgi:hypothetical protein
MTLEPHGQQQVADTFLWRSQYPAHAPSDRCVVAADDSCEHFSKRKYDFTSTSSA